ncbi:MAG TPA: hypothetical protein VGT61_13070 [Thermomicrobiales bacterium]|nr:hypothetical protein [Thermomicrobiales bacterium]
MKEPGDVRYAEFRPPDDVRIFPNPAAGVLLDSPDVLVLQVHDGQRLVRHHAFARQWLSATVLLDEDGTPVPQPAAAGGAFLVKCHVATPLRREDDLCWQVDLWLDVLLAEDGRTPILEDEDEFAAARTAGLLSKHEAAKAIESRDAIARLIRSGGLLPYLGAILPFDATVRPAAGPMIWASIGDYPMINTGRS